MRWTTTTPVSPPCRATHRRRCGPRCWRSRSCGGSAVRGCWTDFAAAPRPERCWGPAVTRPTTRLAGTRRRRSARAPPRPRAPRCSDSTSTLARAQSRWHRHRPPAFAPRSAPRPSRCRSARRPPTACAARCSSRRAFDVDAGLLEASHGFWPCTTRPSANLHRTRSNRSGSSATPVATARTRRSTPHSTPPAVGVTERTRRARSK